MTRSKPYDDPARVLVVDDDRDTVHSMACLLRHMGHQVRVAFDGYEAIEIAHQQQPRYVLLDLGMPGLDGYQVAARLRRELPGSLILIAVTGYGQEEDRRNALAAGFDHHFLKPVDIAVLNALLSGQDTGRWGGRTTLSDQPIPMSNGSVASGSSQVRDDGSSNGSAEPASVELPTAVINPEESQNHLHSRQVEITNTLGLHLRAADKFVRLARQFQAEVRVACDGRKVSGRSMLDLMALAAACGTCLELEADGPDAQAALDALSDLIAREFDEPNH